MNRRIITGIVIAAIGLGLIVLGVYAIGRIVRQSLAPLPAPTPVVELTTPVVVTTHDMVVGAVLNSDDVQVVEMPVGLVPRNAVTQLESVIGRMTTVHLIQGEMILEHHLADPTNVSHDIGYIIDNNQVLMAFPAEDLMSTISVLQRGDLVDILASISENVPVQQIGPNGEPVQLAPGETQPTEPRLFTFDVLQKITISAVVEDVIVQQGNNQTIQVQGNQPQPTPRPQDIIIKAYLLALNPQDALVLKNLIDAGATFDIVLRSPVSSSQYELVPVTTEYLIERFGLTVSK